MTVEPWDFRVTRGVTLLESESPSLRLVKLCDQLAFERFESDGEWDYGSLFCNCPSESLESACIGRGLAGEYFCNVIFGRDLRLGENTNFLAHGCIVMGDRVRIDNDCQLITVFHNLHPDQRLPTRNSPIIIHDGVHLERNVLVVSSRRNGNPLIVGKNAKVLRDSVVVENVPADSIVGGKPARIMTEMQAQAYEEQTTVLDPRLVKVVTTEQAKRLLSSETAFILPFYIHGAEHIANDGYYFINRNSKLLLNGPVIIGTNTLIGPVVEICVEPGGELRVEADVWFGAGVSVSVASGVSITIGRGSLLAAGACVTQSIPGRSVVVGRNHIKKTLGDADRDQRVPQEWCDIQFFRKRVELILRMKKVLAGSELISSHLGEVIRNAQYRIGLDAASVVKRLYSCE